jgi:hypothetical protein
VLKKLDEAWEEIKDCQKRLSAWKGRGPMRKWITTATPEGVGWVV